LPSYPELTSLFGATASASTGLPAGHPFVVPASASARSTTRGFNADDMHYAIIFGSAVFITGVAADSQPLGEWCVRGPDH
jgi:hypothetical protein